jgi:cytochrome c-type biogenesis protein
MQDPLSLTSLVGALLAGVLSVLSPCVLPLMPAYLSLISGISVDEMQSNSASRSRVLLGCLGFFLGFTAVFVALGASASAVGRLLVTWNVLLFGFEIRAVQVAGLIIIVMGLHMVGLFSVSWFNREFRLGSRLRSNGLIGAFLIGAAFAFGWSPCVGPILGSILTIAGARDTATDGMLLLSVYSLGLGIPFFLAGASLDTFLRWFASVRRHLPLIKILSGCFLVAIGTLILTNRLASLNSYFTFMNRIVEAAEALLL